MRRMPSASSVMPVATKKGLAGVPPLGETALRIGVDEGQRSGAGPLGLHGDMAGQRRLSRPAFLRGNGNHLHVEISPGANIRRGQSANYVQQHQYRLSRFQFDICRFL
jgi:hypothetical protein